MRQVYPIDVEALRTQAGRASSLLGAMCNEKRLMILCQLADGERSVGELTTLLGSPQSTISQHLSLLRGQGLVSSRRDGQVRYYSLAGNEAREIIRTLQSLFCAAPPEDTQR